MKLTKNLSFAGHPMKFQMVKLYCFAGIFIKIDTIQAAAANVFSYAIFFNTLKKGLIGNSLLYRKPVLILASLFEIA